MTCNLFKKLLEVRITEKGVCPLHTYIEMLLHPLVQFSSNGKSSDGPGQNMDLRTSFRSLTCELGAQLLGLCYAALPYP